MDTSFRHLCCSVFGLATEHAIEYLTIVGTTSKESMMALVRAEFKIGGMNCAHCVATVRKVLDALPLDAQDVIVGRVRVEFDPTKVNQNDIITVIANEGYDVDLV